MSFAAFQSYCDQQNYKVSIRDDLVPQMRSIVFKTFQAVQPQFSKQLQKNMNFELFGYDFMLDHDFNMWLIEVNTNPCLEVSSPLLKMLLPRMIEDML